MSIEDVKATPVKQNAESDVTPVVNVVSPTPTKDDSYNASSTPTTSESIRGLGTFNASHRVLYRGSLCFLNGETDISLEGDYPKFISPCLELTVHWYQACASLRITLRLQFLLS